MKKVIQEFKDFAIKGNMIDIAIGVIIGTAFNDVINVLVKKVVMPPLSLLTDDVNLSQKKMVLRAGSDTISEVAIGYGELIEVSIDFLIIALTIFIVIKGMNTFRNKAEDPENTEVITPKDIELLANIERLIEEQNTLLKKTSK